MYYNVFIFLRYKAVHYQIFRDATNQLKQRVCNGEGIYFRLGGDIKKEIFYIATIPPGILLSLPFVFL